MLCPNCGCELVELMQENSIKISCPNCDYQSTVTTDDSSLVYSVFLDTNNKVSEGCISLLRKFALCTKRDAEYIINHLCPFLIFEGNKDEAFKIKDEFDKNNISVLLEIKK